MIEVEVIVNSCLLIIDDLIDFDLLDVLILNYFLMMKSLVIFVLFGNF